jgi:glycosyltransferase involved in cell wall biosynthesis
MRIGIDATICFTPKPTGLGIYTINVVNELAKIHDDFVVWTVNDAGMQLDSSKVRKVMQRCLFLGEHLFLLRPFWINTFLPRLLKREKIDVLFTTVPSALACPPIPHVLTVLDLIPLTFPNESPAPVCWNYRHRVPKVLNNASALLSISEYTKKDLNRILSIDFHKVHTTYLGYDRSNFFQKNDPGLLLQHDLKAGNYLLYVGNASPRKNLLNLIGAFARVKETVPHKLVLCGAKKKHELSEIMKQITADGVDGRVVLIDYVPYEKLPVLYSSAAAFLYVSKYEGFGLPIVEAMACGTPVVASNTTSIPEVAGTAAVLVNPDDSADIARGILEVLLNENRKDVMIRQGYEQCQKFTWSRAATETLEILKNVHDEYQGMRE